MEETFGEDPVLTSTLGVAFMKGMQGEVQNDGKHLFSTLKHFAAYGIPESGQWYSRQYRYATIIFRLSASFQESRKQEQAQS